MGLLLLSSCTVNIKDETLYWDAGDAGAVTANFLTPGSSMITQPAWDNMREGMACVSSDTVADLKAELEQLCSLCNCCTYPAGITNFFTRAELARQKAIQLKGANNVKP